MGNANTEPSKKYLLKRGFIIFFFIGILFTIAWDKTVLTYFLKLKTIIQILLITILGGLLSSWVDYQFVKINNRRKSQNLN
jgi:hypothetical protein